MKKNKRILITGGAGFIGSHLAQEFVKEGFQVRILDDFSSGNVNNILPLFNYSNFKMIRGSIVDSEIVSKAMSDVDFVFHLAAQVHVDRSIIEPRHTFNVNTLGTLNVLDAALEHNIEFVAYASTSEVYGSAIKVPMDENHPLNPASPYAASKAAADRLCFSYYNTYKLPLVIVRCFNTYGPRQKDCDYAAAIPKFIRRALANQPPVIYGDGKQTRDYMYVKDAVRAYSLVLDSYEKLLGHAVNFGSGKEISILELARMIIKLSGRNLTPIHAAKRTGEVTRLCANTTFAEKTVGFKPQYNLEKGLQELINWYQDGAFDEWASYTSGEIE